MMAPRRQTNGERDSDWNERSGASVALQSEDADEGRGEGAGVRSGVEEDVSDKGV
jgi:hypothetical protein